jgi:hypothetical protein
MTNEQLYIAVRIPMLFNAALLGLVIAYINARIGKVESKFDARFEVMDARFQTIDGRFQAIDKRFDANRHAPLRAFSVLHALALAT